MNDAFYRRKEEFGKSVLAGKLKDRFLQQTTRNIANKINYDVQDIMEFIPISGNYDITCFSDGAIYFLEDGCVKAEMIVGDEVYNRSYLSHSSSNHMFKMVYSEPKDEKKITFKVGEIGRLILEAIGAEDMLQFDGTDLIYYQYTADDGSNMTVYFNGDGDVIFIVVY